MISSRSFIILLLFIVLVSCTKVQPELRNSLKRFSQSFDTFDSIKAITTKNGFNSILYHSDTLREKTFIQALLKSLSEEEIFQITETDSTIVLSLGRQDKIAGATAGYLFLKRNNGHLLIDEYRSGK
jgi:hypothetical protein